MNIKNKNMQVFHLIYSVITSLCIIISGLLLIISCININNSGKQPFSREAVGDAFSLIAVPVYICLILTIAGFLIDIFFKTDIPKQKLQKNYEATLKTLYSRKDTETAGSSAIATIKRLEKRRTMYSTIRIVILTLCSAIFLIYALDDSHFHQSDINGSMIKAMYILVPCLLVGFICTLVTVYLNEKCIRAQIDILKSLPAKNSTDNASKSAGSSGKALEIARYIILLIAVIFIIYGFISGGTADVLTKAINICTECIGLG